MAYLRGRVEEVAFRQADITNYWHAQSERFPEDARFVRAEFGSALRHGRIAEAESCMASLLRARTLCAEDCKTVMGLVYAYDRRGDLAAARRLLRSFLKALFGKRDYRIAALKICRAVFAHFRRYRTRDAPFDQAQNRAQTFRMLNRAGVRVEPQELLRRVLACEEALASRSVLYLPDTDISRTQCEEFVQLVRLKLSRRVPFSFVRVGDGEAACLAYEPQLAWLADGDARARERIWWGRALTSTQRRVMGQRVSSAIRDSDCVGIPPISRYLRELRLGDDDCLDGSLTGRGLRAILMEAERWANANGNRRSPAAITSCHVHQDLARWDLYPQLFRDRPELVLVSCHAGLADYVKTRFGTRVVKDIVIPPDRVTAPALSASSRPSRRFPDMLYDVEQEFAEWPSGRLVLVGAGYLGKWLVDRARARGGIALDLGSIFDQWLGLTTRSYLDLHAM